jgi:hypothetical protein
MKKLIVLTTLIFCIIPVWAQADKADRLASLEQNLSDNQTATTTATVKTASRLFGAKDDLTSVITIIPAGSTVTVLGTDSTYFHVTFEENDGYILKRQAIIDKTPVNTNPQTEITQQQQPVTQPAQTEQVSRFTYLEEKYGSNMAARLNAGKIWKGMNAEMVKDSWGTAEKINRVISGNIVKEEWIFKNTWLYFENNVLVDWGPTRK